MIAVERLAYNWTRTAWRSSGGVPQRLDHGLERLRDIARDVAALVRLLAYCCPEAHGGVRTAERERQR